MTKKIPEGRGKHVRVKTARGRKLSSTRWLQRQLNDPYVAKAKSMGLRSRAAFKLLDINEKYHILKPGMCVVDLGSAPGGWIQVALQHVGRGKGQVVGIDLQEIDPIEGATLIQGDFMDDAMPQIIKDYLKGEVDVVLSDMAAPACGHPQTDHIRIMALAEAAFDFAKGILTPGGSFVAKVLRGGTEKELLDQLKTHFQKVSHFKPPSSRKDSAEMFVIGIGFRK